MILKLDASSLGNKGVDSSRQCSQVYTFRRSSVLIETLENYMYSVVYLTHVFIHFLYS